MYLPSELNSCHIIQPAHVLMGLEEVGTSSIRISSN